MLASLVGWAKAESKIVPTPQRPGRLCPPYKPPDERIPSQHTNHTLAADAEVAGRAIDRKSTRLNSSHANISYAVFCLKKKNNCKCRLSVLHHSVITRES